MNQSTTPSTETSLAVLFEAHIGVLRLRMDEALASAGFDTAAIYAGRPWMQFLDDQPYPFKVNPHFKWWAPLLDAPECWIVYRPARRLQLVFLQPVDYWHKPPPTPDDYWTPHFDIELIRQPHDARQVMATAKRCAFIGEWQIEFESWEFADRNPAGLLEQLHHSRAKKTTYELECMRRASTLGARGHHVAEAAFRSGASEYQIHLAYLQATEHAEADLPYPNIIALNSNAAVLHYQHQERRAPGSNAMHSFLIDAGAQFAGYASDITRTYSAAQDDFAALIASMDGLQQTLCLQVRDGVDYADIHLNAHLRIAALLHDARIITLSAEDAVATGLSGIFFPHGVGHLLGLQVHDVAGFSTAPGIHKPQPPGHPYLRLTRTLEPGFVVTIEPGLYFIDALLDSARNSAHAKQINWPEVERLRRYGGIRVEDNVACTAAAPENLTRDAFERSGWRIADGG